jgi:hypothetical protein
MDDERAGGAEIQAGSASEPLSRGGNPLQRLGRRGILEQWGDYCGHYWALSRKEFRVIRTLLKVAKSASPLRGTRKTRQRDFRKAEAKLVPAALPGRAPSGILAAGLWMAALATLLSRPLWLYSRAKET